MEIRRSLNKAEYLPAIGRLILRHSPFIVLFVGGLTLRALATVAYYPALLYYGDSYYYLKDAVSLSPESFHPLGYALFLHLLSWTNNLASVVFMQHMMSLCAAILIYVLFYKKLTVNPWLAAIAASPVLLDGYTINSETMVMSEALTSLLLVTSFILIIWGVKRRIPWQICVAGLVLGFATITRSVTVVLILPAAAYLFLSNWHQTNWRQRLIPVILLAVTFAVPLIGYCGYHKSVDGNFAVDTKTNLFLYGRLAPLANCSLLSPVLQPLCSTKPINERAGPTWFLWARDSPLRQALKVNEYNAPQTPLKQFNLAVLKGQWANYATSVVIETARYFVPGRQGARGDDPIQDVEFPTKPRWTHNTFLAVKSFAVNHQVPGRLPLRLRAPRIAQFLHSYQQWVYVPGPLLAISIIIAPLAWIKRRRLDQTVLAATLLVVSALMFLGVTSALAAFNYRYLMPIQEVLWAGGVLAISSLFEVRLERCKNANSSQITPTNSY